MTRQQNCELEFVVECPLCRNQDFRFVHKMVFQGVSCTNVICSRCSLVFQNPRPGKDFLGDYYYREYAAFLNRKPTGSQSGPDEQALRNAAVKARRIEELIEAHMLYSKKGVGAVLDIGASAGVLLDRFKEKGYATFGVEPNEVYARYAQAKGHRIELGMIGEHCFEGHVFDIVTLVHVLEHLPDPVGILSAIRSKLKPGGLLAVEVPNIMRPNGPLAGFFQTPHLYTYSCSTLLRTLKLAGFSHIFRVDDRYPHLRVLAANGISQVGALEISAEDLNQPWEEVLRALRKFSVRYNFCIAPVQALKGGVKFLFPRKLLEWRRA